METDKNIRMTIDFAKKDERFYIIGDQEIKKHKAE